MKKVKVAILGCNYMGKMHADCYRLLKDVEVVAVADLNEETARKVAEPFQAQVFTDAEELIKQCEVDAVDICLPTFLHTKFAVQAMEKTPYIFIEKPVALNVAECDTLVRKQRETGAQVQVGQVIRFWDEYAYLKDVVDDKRYGELVNLSLKRLSPSPLWSKNDWIRNSKLSGGAIVDLHIHDIDYMLYLLGMPNTSYSIKNTRGEPNSYITTVCEYDDFVVSVEATWYLPSNYPFQMYYRAVFERGVVELNGGKITVYEGERTFTPTIEKKQCTGDFSNGNISELAGYFNELEYFTDCIKNERPIEKARLQDGVSSLTFLLNTLAEKR